MIRLINCLFSNEYVNHKAIGGNLLLLFMYRFAFPFSFVLNKLGFSPNQITTASTLLAMFAAVCLIFDLSGYWFVIFWFSSLLLDFCDGTVARMTGNISKAALRYDHVSDLFKIFIVMLAAGIYYNSLWVWVSAMTASFTFMYYTVLNHELGDTKNFLGTVGTTDKECSKNPKDKKVGRLSFAKKLIKNAFLFKLLRSIYIALITINGHTLLLFLVIPLGSKLTIIAFSYFIFISTLGLVRVISELRALPRKPLLNNP